MIVSVAPLFPALLNQNGTLVLSGILAEEFEEVLSAMNQVGGRLVETRKRDRWNAIAVRCSAGSERRNG
jgi:ribosomal protein L11 methylase PrmA